MPVELSRNLLIAIEGLDGTGKSTVACLLAKRLNGVVYATPPPEFVPIRKALDSSRSLSARFYYYLSSVCYAGAEASGLREHSHVILDRYVSSTIACHKALGLHIDIDATSLDLPVPDFTFLLTAPNERERRRRIRSRAICSSSDRRVDEPAIRAAMMREFRRFGFPEIDTTNITAHQVVDTIICQIGLTNQVVLRAPS